MLTKKCILCENDFTDNTPGHSRKYCSTECKEKGLEINLKRNLDKLNKKNRENSMGYKEGKIIGICEYCGEDYNKRVPNQRYCSKECKVKDYDEILNFEKLPTYKSTTWLKLRFKVFLRDNFTCQYCGRNVKEDNVKLEVEHIIPKSRGGEFLINNLTTSCVECNCGKGCILLNEKEKEDNEED